MPKLRKTAFKWAALLGGAMLCTNASAERALIIANFAYDGVAPQAEIRKKAEDLSETFFGLGYIVNRLENPQAGELDTAFASLAQETGPVVIYYAGRSQVDGDQTLLQMARADLIALDDMLKRAGTGNRDMTALFLDICRDVVAEVADVTETTDTADDTTDNTLPFAGLGPLPQIGPLFVAAPVAADSACRGDDPNLTDLMLDRLLVPGLGTDGLFADTDVVTETTLSAPFTFRTVDTGMRLTADDYNMLDNLSPEAQEQMLALWAAAGIAIDRSDTPAPQTANRIVTNETVVLTSPVKPVSTGGATLSPITSTATRVTSGVRLAPQGAVPIPASATPARPVPGAGGLPRPSIIVGVIAPTEANFPTAAAPTGPVAGAAIEYDDLEGRRNLRDSDPELFATLVETGAFDPPAVELVVALQTELARMNCYNAGIDGAWGPGSRGAVGRYYEQIDGASPSQDPDVAIFRQIMMRDDVTCPAVVRAAPAPRASTPRRTTTPRASTPQAAPAPAPAPAPAAPSRTINRNTGTGIFR